MLAPTPRPILSLKDAVVWDIETLPNLFSMNVVALEGELDLTFQISEFVDDRDRLFEWIDHWKFHNTIMIGFNSLSFDYSVLHYILENRRVSVGEIYLKAMSIISSESRFGTIIWQSERHVPQCDLFRLWHMDNKAKSTSLKALQFNMRSENVMEMPLPWGVPVTWQQINDVVLPYNRHDVRETKRFALISKEAIEFRLGLDLPGDVLNFNDSKIGSKILEARLGRDVCYTQEGQPRQSPRTSIPLREIIFPYIQFRQPAFQKVLEWMKQQTLSTDELTEKLQTKGVFTGKVATIDGFTFHFGTGGIHGSTTGRFQSDDEWQIVDIDVAGLYPAIAIVNRLYPEHLGERFIEEYAKLPAERALYKKGTVQNAALKLAANGTYGNSNNQYSVFYDPRFTMAITINGQLLLCMLAEWLLMVHSLRLLAINTDGITYQVRKQFAPHANIQRDIWQRVTGLVLEEALYKRMWLRDVNNYCAEDVKGKLKLKGAYWYPDKFPDDITNAGPPAWHKDLSCLVVIRAAVAHMVQGIDVGEFVRSWKDPFDFMLRAKVDCASRLVLSDVEQQRITRYYVTHDGQELKKVSPPKGEPGAFKRRSKVSDWDWHHISQSVAPGQWDERIHTKNKSRYETRVTSIERSVAVCNRAADFDWSRVDYSWYEEQARKLIIC